MRRPRWPWLYGRFRFQLLNAHRDVEVRMQVGPTKWGPWRALTQPEFERLQPDARKLAQSVQRFPHYGGQAEAIVRVLPPREGE